MATTPKPEPTAAQHETALIAMYLLAERELLQGFTSIVRQMAGTGLTSYAVLGPLRRLVRRWLDYLAGGDDLAAAMVSTSVAEGAREARRQTRDLRAVLAAAPGTDSRGGSRGPGDGRPPGRDLELPDDGFFDLSMPHGDRAAQAIRDDITSELKDVRRRITRLPDDIYKMIAPHGATYQVLANDVTPAQAQAMAWQVFVSQGVTGFTDRSGRDWALSSYVEMAVRTASQRAYNASHLARMRAVGIEYFTVPASGHPCPLCFPWQGRVITAEPIENPVIPVAGTIEQATATGLFHPNCRHTLIPVYPGITKLEPGVWTDQMQREYTLTQRQRAIERDIRKAKQQFNFALTPEARTDATQKVRRQQARMRVFVRDTGFTRQSRREQVHLTDDRGPNWNPPHAQEPPPTPPRPFGPPSDRVPGPAFEVSVSERSMVGAQVRQARRAIEKVHTVPDTVRPVKITDDANMAELGKYSPMRSLIEIRSQGPAVQLTVAHEIGHYIDHRVLGQSTTFLETKLPTSRSTLRWLRVVQDSPEVRRLQEILAGADDDPDLETHIRYLLTPSEMFARAYSQWIAVRSGDEALSLGVEWWRERKDEWTRARQWGSTEFEPIADAIDAMFREKGLLL
ncbi:phage minor capsid protein [Agromyces ramosus]|uniref:Minor capsid protein 2 n=1 Tax=Agromyces ramosus TaxID=33879 RepID=A0ABU0R8N8_9MICO|nr:phage minor capsid protein [Agromyces ramosus]MDQ0894436.1 hypothetical protein [Agromyces ramosus]